MNLEASDMVLVSPIEECTGQGQRACVISSVGAKVRWSEKMHLLLSTVASSRKDEDSSCQDHDYQKKAAKTPESLRQ
jgi:hypothetical protein